MPEPHDPIAQFRAHRDALISLRSSLKVAASEVNDAVQALDRAIDVFAKSTRRVARAGRPSKVTPAHRSALLKMLEADPASEPGVLFVAVKQQGFTGRPSTIRTFVRRWRRGEGV
jgi:hypothetical protein